MSGGQAVGSALQQSVTYQRRPRGSASRAIDVASHSPDAV